MAAAVGHGEVSAPQSALLSLSLQAEVGGEHRQVALAALELGHTTHVLLTSLGSRPFPN